MPLGRASARLPAKASIRLSARWHGRNVSGDVLRRPHRSSRLCRMSKCRASDSGSWPGDDDKDAREELLERVASMNLYSACAPEEIGSEYGEVRMLSASAKSASTAQTQSD